MSKIPIPKPTFKTNRSGGTGCAVSGDRVADGDAGGSGVGANDCTGAAGGSDGVGDRVSRTWSGSCN